MVSHKKIKKKSSPEININDNIKKYEENIKQERIREKKKRIKKEGIIDDNDNNIISNKKLLEKTIMKYSELDEKGLTKISEIDEELNSTIGKLEKLKYRIQQRNLLDGNKWNKIKNKGQKYFTEDNDEPLLNFIFFLIKNNFLNNEGLKFIYKLSQEQFEIKSVDEIHDTIERGLEIYEFGIMLQDEKILNPIKPFLLYLIKKKYILSTKKNELIQLLKKYKFNRNDLSSYVYDNFDKIKRLFNFSKFTYEIAKSDTLLNTTIIEDGIYKKFNDKKKELLSDPCYQMLNMINDEKYAMYKDTPDGIKKRKEFLLGIAKTMKMDVLSSKKIIKRSPKTEPSAPELSLLESLLELPSAPELEPSDPALVIPGSFPTSKKKVKRSKKKVKHSKKKVKRSPTKVIAGNDPAPLETGFIKKLCSKSYEIIKSPIKIYYNAKKICNYIFWVILLSYITKSFNNNDSYLKNVWKIIEDLGATNIFFVSVGGLSGFSGYHPIPFQLLVSYVFGKNVINNLIPDNIKIHFKKVVNDNKAHLEYLNILVADYIEHNIPGMLGFENVFKEIISTIREFIKLSSKQDLAIQKSKQKFIDNFKKQSDNGYLVTTLQNNTIVSVEQLKLNPEVRDALIIAETDIMQSINEKTLKEFIGTEKNFKQIGEMVVSGVFGKGLSAKNIKNSLEGVIIAVLLKPDEILNYIPYLNYFLNYLPGLKLEPSKDNFILSIISEMDRTIIFNINKNEIIVSTPQTNNLNNIITMFATSPVVKTILYSGVKVILNQYPILSTIVDSLFINSIILQEKIPQSATDQMNARNRVYYNKENIENEIKDIKIQLQTFKLIKNLTKKLNIDVPKALTIIKNIGKNINENINEKMVQKYIDEEIEKNSKTIEKSLLDQGKEKKIEFTRELKYLENLKSEQEKEINKFNEIFDLDVNGELLENIIKNKFKLFEGDKYNRFLNFLMQPETKNRLYYGFGSNFISKQNRLKLKLLEDIDSQFFQYIEQINSYTMFGIDINYLEYVKINKDTKKKIDYPLSIINKLNYEISGINKDLERIEDFIENYNFIHQKSFHDITTLVNIQNFRKILEKKSSTDYYENIQEIDYYKNLNNYILSENRLEKLDNDLKQFNKATLGKGVSPGKGVPSGKGVPQTPALQSKGVSQPPALQSKGVPALQSKGVPALQSKGVSQTPALQSKSAPALQSKGVSTGKSVSQTPALQAEYDITLDPNIPLNRDYNLYTKTIDINNVNNVDNDNSFPIMYHPDHKNTEQLPQQVRGYIPQQEGFGRPVPVRLVEDGKTRKSKRKMIKKKK